MNMSGSGMRVGTSSLIKPKPPPIIAPFKIDPSTKLEDWKKWQIAFRQYAHAVNLDQRSHDVQLSTFKSMVGPDALQIYNTFSILDIADLESVIRKFDEHFKPKVNSTLERYKLYKLCQKSGQEFDDYLTGITNQVDKCGFDSMRDDILLYKIVGGIESDVVRKALLAEADLKYEVAVGICRAAFSAKSMSGKENSRMRKAPGSDGDGAIEVTQGASKREAEGKVNKDVADESSSQEGNPLDCVQEKGNPSPNKQTNLRGKAGGKKGSTRNKKSKVEGVGDGTEGVPKELLFERMYVRLPASRQKDGKNVDGKGATGVKDGGSDDGDDWRGVDGDYIIEIDPLQTAGEMKKEQDDPDSKKWRKKKSYVKWDKRLPCDMCDQTFRMEVSLEKHRKTHLPPQQKDVTCYHCGKIYKKNILRRHVKDRHFDILGIPGPELYACDVCNFTTLLRKNLERHKFQHTGEKPLTCEHCDYKCITPRLLKGHIAKKHTGETPYPCEVCGKGFVHIDAMKKHRNVHLPQSERKNRPQTKWPCGVCERMYTTKASLQTHMLRHTGEKRFTCHVCGFKTVTNGALSAHMLAKHSDEKPFVCNVCGYSCKQQAHLKTHLLTHTAERPHSCEVCGKKFSQIAHVKRHMLVHTGEKPHVCEVCGHRWTTKDNLKAHMKVHQKPGGSHASQPRKRRKVVTIVPAESDESESDATPTATVIAWTEQVTAVDSIDYTANLETPQPFHPTYPVHQGNPRPADCRYQQRLWPNQGYR